MLHPTRIRDLEMKQFNKSIEQKNERRENRMLLTLFILLASSFVFSACEKDNKESEIELPEYITLSKDLLGDHFDFAVLGKDGTGYFYKYQDDNPNIPKQLLTWNGDKGIVDLVINFDEVGLPKNILSEDFTVILGNYYGNIFDAVVITKDGKTHVFENTETDLNWDEYLYELGTGTKSTVLTRSFLGLSSNTLKWIGTGLNAVSCAFGNFLGCMSFVIDIGQAVGLFELPGADILVNYVGFLTCSGADVIGCFASIVGILSYDAEMRNNSATEYIKTGENILASNTDGTVSERALSVFVSGSDVYAAGYESRNVLRDGFYNTVYSVAKLWKNGVAQNLSDGTTVKTSASSVYVSDGDVYVAGHEIIGNKRIAVLWKNGVMQRLTDGSAWEVASSVFVSGNDVYVVTGHPPGGSSSNAVAALWKNGIHQNLSNRGDQPFSVFVSGNNVYVAGKGFWQSAMLWTNGVVQTLNSAAEAYSVCTSGSDVYVAGVRYYYDNQYSTATLWKNGVAQSLTSTNVNKFASANSVYVSGNNVYVAGHVIGTSGYSNSYRAVLWKNGLGIYLSTNTSFATSVYVSGNDVYIAGYESNDNIIGQFSNSIAKLWKIAETQ